MRTKKVLLVFLNFLFFISCTSKHIQQKENKAALIDGDTIYFNEIDNLAEQELYDELYRIYLIRKTTLDLLINNKLIFIEASKKEKTIQQYLDDYYKSKINPSNLELYIKTNQLKEGIPDLKRGLRYVDPYSDEGKPLLIYNYKRYLKTHLLDSLKKSHNVITFLKAPVAPDIDLTANLILHYHGNTKSKINFIEISDFENGLSQKSFALTDSIFNKYKDKVKFGFTHFASYPTICAIASECAARQGKFWEIYDVLTKLKSLPDTIELYRIADNLELDMKQFDSDFHDKSLIESINQNFDNIRSIGLYGSPSYLVNGKLIFNSASISEMESAIQQAINNN